MEYGQIFHVTRIGKYYCKNMKYRINFYSILHILTIIFPDTRNVEYLPIFHGIYSRRRNVRYEPISHGSYVMA